MATKWPRSSAKHGISRNDALFAISNAIFTSDNVSAAGSISTSGRAGTRRLFIGHPYSQSLELIEVLVESRPNGDVVIYHVMALSSKYRKQMEDER